MIVIVDVRRRKRKNIIVFYSMDRNKKLFWDDVMIVEPAKFRIEDIVVIRTHFEEGSKVVEIGYLFVVCLGIKEEFGVFLGKKGLGLDCC